MRVHKDRADETPAWIPVFQGPGRDASSLQAELGVLGVEAILEAEAAHARLLIAPDLPEEVETLVRQLVAQRVREGIWEEPDPDRAMAETLARRICQLVLLVVTIPLALLTAPSYLRLAATLDPRPRGHRTALVMLTLGLTVLLTALLVVGYAASR